MWLLVVLLLADTSRAFSIALAPAESVWVTVEGVGDPVVLIPGLFGSAFGYRSVLPRLVDAGYRPIVIEPLGIGTSARPEHADYSLTAQADRVAAALDRLGVGDAIVVAHSVGAAIAYRLAYRRPDLVRGIVSLDVGTAGRGSGVSPQEVATLARLLRSFAVDTVPGAGHFVYEERPAAVVAAVQRLNSRDGHPEGRLLRIGGRYYNSPP